MYRGLGRHQEVIQPRWRLEVRVFQENYIFQMSLEGKVGIDSTRKEKVLQSKFCVCSPGAVRRKNTLKEQTQGKSFKI